MSDPILELLAAPPNPPMSVDEDAVHAGGRRRLRRRTLRRTGIGLVGVVGATAIAFSTLGSGVGGEALPAGPSPTIASGFRVSAELLEGRYAVEVVPDAPSGQPNVIFHSVTNGERQRLAGSDASPDVVSMGTGSGAEGVMLGTAPADAATFLTVTRDGTKGGIQTDQQPLPGTDYQAVALKFDDPKEVDSYVDTIWLDPDGRVHSANGQVLPSTKIADGDTFFVARDSGVMGTFMADGSGGSTRPLSGSATTTMGYGLKEDGGDWTWTSVTLLPAGATDVSFTWANAGSTDETATFSPEDMTVAWASATAPGAGSGPSVTKVSWTDKDGIRHTDAVE